MPWAQGLGAYDAGRATGPTIEVAEAWVPTVDSRRTLFLLDAMARAGQANVLLCAEPSAGKSRLLQRFCAALAGGADAAPAKLEQEAGKLAHASVMFDSFATAGYVQDLVEARMERRGGKDVLWPPSGTKKMVFVVDDLGMPQQDAFGTQGALELLRQLLDARGVYDRSKSHWKSIRELQVVGACKPRGVRAMSARLRRQFYVLQLPAPSGSTLASMFGTIWSSWAAAAPADKGWLLELRTPLAKASVAVYEEVKQTLRPIPSKAHYTFNTHTLFKTLQGLLLTPPSCIADADQLLRIWCHEQSRVCGDRLVDSEDGLWFEGLLCRTLSSHFGRTWERCNFAPTVMGDFTVGGGARPYRECVSAPAPGEDAFAHVQQLNRAVSTLRDSLDDYNMGSSLNNMGGGSAVNMVFFDHAIGHVRNTCRVLRQSRGHMLMLGMSGSGPSTNQHPAPSSLPFPDSRQFPSTCTTQAGLICAGRVHRC